MTARKDKAIRELVARLGLASRGWQVVDHWEADLQAIGIATKDDPRRLVYVSTFSRTPGHFDYQCETPAGPADENYTTTAYGEDVDYETLLSAMEAHLG